MVDERRTRTCGNCGEEVGSSDTTCPSCGALLAAYEAPAGSATESDLAGPITFDAFEVETSPAREAQPDSTMVTDTRVTPPERVTEPAPFDAAAAMEEARRVLGMSQEPRKEAREVVDTPVSVPMESPPTEPEPAAASIVITPLNPEPKPAAPPTPDPVPEVPIPPTQSAPWSVPASSPHARTERDTTPPPSPLANTVQQEIPHRQPAPAPAMGTNPIAPTVGTDAAAPHKKQPNLGSIVAIIPVMLVLCWMMATLDFSNVFVLGVVLLILFNLMKVAASASGRKTTTMPPPDRNDRWSV